jgi:hypothetical protein
MIVGYRWRLGGRSRLDGRMMHRMDKAWHIIQCYITGDKEIARMGLGMTRTGMGRLGKIITRMRRLLTRGSLMTNGRVTQIFRKEK